MRSWLDSNFLSMEFPLFGVWPVKKTQNVQNTFPAPLVFAQPYSTTIAVLDGSPPDLLQIINFLRLRPLRLRSEQPCGLQSNIFTGSTRSKKGCDPQIHHLLNGPTRIISRLVYLSTKSCQEAGACLCWTTSNKRTANVVIISNAANTTTLFLTVPFGAGYTLGFSITGVFVDITFSSLLMYALK